MALAPHELSCESCGAKLVVGASHRTARCPYCDSPSVIDRPATPDRPDPVFAIGFSIDGNRARQRLRDYLNSHRWAPAALRQATVEKVEGIYLPAYLYSAIADSRYAALIGEDYQEMEYDAKKKRMRQVTKTEYRELTGRHRCFVEDRLVTASEGIPNGELENIEPFDLGGLRRYSTAVISGWISEEPSLTRDACLDLARDESRDETRRRLAVFMPGDSHSRLQSATDLTDEAMDLVLIPVWVCALRWHHEKPPIRLLVNGQTGEVAGDVPISWSKILGAIGAVLGVLGLGALIGAVLGWFV